jgi:hypothetical protein
MVGIQYTSFLPELVSGRGTTRRSRVVEGQARGRLGDDPVNNSVRILEEFNSRNTKRFNSSGMKPLIPSGVMCRPVPPGMGFAVDLNREASIAAEEVENIRPRRMLAAEFQAVRFLAEHLPKDHFGQSHLTPKVTRVFCRGLPRFRRDVFQHGYCPSTMLRLVPLPETSSGRNWSVA